MKLWLLAQEENNGYDTYDSAVVAAETEEEARLITPDGFPFKPPSERRYSNWAYSPAGVKVEYLGEAAEGIEASPILGSFNAG